jgi:hypothetical protein
MAEEKSQDVPYQRTDKAANWWVDSVAGLGWTRQEANGHTLWWTKQGMCPRCLHEDGIDVSTEPGILAVRATGTGEGRVFVGCRCSAETHEGRPEGASGCGWRGYVPGPEGS